MTKNKKTAKITSKKPAKPVKKTAVKAVSKPVNKSVKKVSAPVKNSKKATPIKAVKAAAPKKVEPKKAAPVAKKADAKASAPIIVKLPNNQNLAPTGKQVVMQKTDAGLKAMTPSAAAAAAQRPVYRPIQVINKPLAPIQPQRQMAAITPSNEKVEFKKGDYVVYPAHGVGQIEGVEVQKVGGIEVKLYAIVFEKDRMRLKVPVFKAHASGLRRLSTGTRMQDALKTLQGRAQVRRAMWSRRAQEYETKINSGDPVSIAEVLRDLKRNTEEIEQSYSERQIYQSALERLAREVAALEKITEVEAAERLETLLRGSRRKAAAPVAGEKTEKEADRKAA